jgi:hypothetical protein
VTGGGYAQGKILPERAKGKPEACTPEQIKECHGEATDKVRGCFSAQIVIMMAFKLCRFAQKRWIRLYHPQRLAEVIKGVKLEIHLCVLVADLLPEKEENR